MDEMDKVVKIYKKLSKTQALIGGKFLRNGIINTIWSQRNIETGKNVKYLRTHLVDSKLSNILSTLPVDISQELLSAISATEKYRAVLRECSNGKETRKQLLEIWTNNNLSHTVDLTSLNVHGDVYTDAEFKSFTWSPNETKIMYIAEKKLANYEPFYKRKSNKINDASDKNTLPINKGEEYVFRQDWGEQLAGKYSSVIAVYDLQDDSVNILEGIPENICPAQVTWSPDGSCIIGVALETEPRKFGLIYCTNRPSIIFQLDFAGNYRCLSEENKSVMCPKFSPDGNFLIWLERDSNGPHHSAMRLMCMPNKLDSASIKPYIVLDSIDNEITTANNKPFYGLYSTNLVERCWASDNKRLILSTPQKCSIKTYSINIESGSIVELNNNDLDSQLVLDVYQDKLLVCKKNYCFYDQCIAAILPSEQNEDTIEWKKITEQKQISCLQNIKYEYLNMKQDTNEEITHFTSIYFGPKCGETKICPLIVWPHGGPHSAFFNTFALEPSVLVCLGFAIVFVNYRGSVGAGQKSVNFLLGRIGSADVQDCILTANMCCKIYPWLNPERMSLVGGSHGGFLIHHLSGQYPDMFKAVISRNPVIDLASMNIVSDIPDWCAVEAGSIYSQKGPIDNKLLLNMRQLSPIQYAHKIKAATYLMLGTKDLRVPMSQGLELYYRLKANNIPVKVNMYDDNHSLSSVPNEMDRIINSALWLIKYT